MNKTQKLLVIFFLALLVGLSGCGNDDNGDSAEAVVATKIAAQETKPAEEKKIAFIELEITVNDTLPLALRLENKDANQTTVRISHRNGKKLIVPDETVDWAVLERLRFAGEGRRGVIERNRTGREQLVTPVPEQSEVRTIALEETVMELFSIIPWPDDFNWHISDENKLIVVWQGSDYSLAADENIELNSVSDTREVFIEQLGPTLKGNTPPAPEITMQPLGETTFHTQVRIHYHGLLALESIQ